MCSLGFRLFRGYLTMTARVRNAIQPSYVCGKGRKVRVKEERVREQGAMLDLCIKEG